MPNHLFPSIILLLVACSNAPEQKAGATTGEQPKTEMPKMEPTVAVGTENHEKPVPEKASMPIAVPQKQAHRVVSSPMPVEVEKTTETPVSAPMTSVTAATFAPISHNGFDSLLQKHVSNNGKVDYKGIKADKAILDAYCQLLADNPPQDDWSRAEKMAFWINAYNAFTIKLITENYPTKSILNFDGGKTWDVRRIRIGDKKYSLNNIENDIIRPTFKDPRIHFAINCAAQSCPPLWNHAFTAENLEEGLESRTKAFVNNAAFNTLSSSRAQVSKIFDWYAADFGTLREFLNKYADTALNSNATIRFNEYNWDLNE